jgi:hypothetical protein
MGCGIEFLKWLSDTEKLPPRGRVLDIGESCLLAATAADIRYVLGRHGCTLPDDAVGRVADEFAYRSNLAGHPTIPTLFLGDVLKLTEVEYVSFDVVSARHADRFDLNVHSLARDRRNWFDLVVNFGTTEHLMNQFNAYKVMHEACAPGGFMFHQLPSTGYINHGYFCYNALMFQELAAANGYELLDLWFYGPNGHGSVLANGDQFPGVMDPTKLRNDVAALRANPVANSLINVLYRKVHDAEFRVGLELKTAAANLADQDEFTSPYIERHGGSRRPARTDAPALPLRRRAYRRLRRMATDALRTVGLI